MKEEEKEDTRRGRPRASIYRAGISVHTVIHVKELLTF